MSNPYLFALCREREGCYLGLEILKFSVTGLILIFSVFNRICSFFIDDFLYQKSSQNKNCRLGEINFFLNFDLVIFQVQLVFKIVSGVKKKNKETNCLTQIYLRYAGTGRGDI